MRIKLLVVATTLISLGRGLRKRHRPGPGSAATPNVWPTPLCRSIVAAGAELDANVHDAGLRAELKAKGDHASRDQGGV